MSEIQEIETISSEIAILLSYGEYKIVDMMLSKAINKFPTMTINKIITYAKSALPAKDKLLKWNLFISIMKTECKKRNFDLSLLKDLN